MPTKDKAKQAAYARKHYEANKALIKARAATYTKKVRYASREYIKTLKETNPCADCGHTYPYYVMDFDHIDGNKACKHI